MASLEVGYGRVLRNFSRMEDSKARDLIRDRVMKTREVSMLNLDGKALTFGLFLFLFLYILHVLLLPLMVGEQAAQSEYQGLLYGINQLLGISTCMFPGFVAGKKSGQQGFLHGGIVGGVGTILTALGAMLWSLITGAKFMGLGMLPFWLLINVFLSGFGGFIANSETQGDENASR